MQAEVILAAARRELDSARAILDVLGGSIADCTADVATARRYLGLGGFGKSVIRTSRPFTFSLVVRSF